MNRIFTFLKDNLEIIFFSLIFYGLSFFLLIKEYLIISNFSFLNNFPILELYRFFIILICFFCLFVGKKTFNKYIFFLIILNIVFLYSSFFGEQIKFTLPANIYYELGLNDKMDEFFSQKNKAILINTFNIILPLIAISYLDFTADKLNKFKDLSIKICDILLILLVILLSYKYFFISLPLLGLEDMPSAISIDKLLINVHSSMYFLNIYFIIISENIFQKKEINFFVITKILLIFYCFLIGDSILHTLISLLTFTIYYLLNKKNTYALLLFSIFFVIVVTSNIFKLTSLDLEFIKFYFNDYQISGSVLHSIFSRLKHIEYFLFLSTNLNFLTGSNIFNIDAYTYPHNLFVDIFITTGVIGLIIFIYVIFNLIILIKRNIANNNLFILILFFQSFIFSNFSGFFFNNIILNISLAACFCILKPKHFTIS